MLPIEGNDTFPSGEFQADESLQTPDLSDIAFESAESTPPNIPQLEEEQHAPREAVPQEEEQQELREEQQEPQEEQQELQGEEGPQGFLADQAKEIGTKGGDSPRSTGKTSSAVGSGLSEFEQGSRRFLSDPESRETRVDSAEELAAVAPDDARDNELPGSSAAPGGARQHRIDLPVGIWIGFHDGETPMMARLAVQDTEEDHFIFVNRKGVKVRQVSGQEFLDLIDRQLVEILEASTNFRDAVSEVRKNRDQ